MLHSALRNISERTVAAQSFKECQFTDYNFNTKILPNSVQKLETQGLITDQLRDSLFVAYCLSCSHEKLLEQSLFNRRCACYYSALHKGICKHELLCIMNQQINLWSLFCQQRSSVFKSHFPFQYSQWRGHTYSFQDNQRLRTNKLFSGNLMYQIHLPVLFSFSVTDKIYIHTPNSHML